MKIAITALLLLNLSISFSQTGTISGYISSKANGGKLVNATISIFSKKNKSFIKMGNSDENGNYSLTFDEGEVYVFVELLGYKDFKTEAIFISNEPNFLNITLEEDSRVLDEVVVMQKNNIIKLDRDKMVVNVDKAGFGIGNDGLETLSKLPGVRLDKDENLVFRGNASLQIMIDGKPSLLSGEDLKQFLKTIDGTNIKLVEIVANPSAKYDAAGTAGIFNIIMKKSAANGLSGNISSSVGYAEYIKNYNGVNLYSNTDKWNLKGGLNYSYTEGVNHRRIDQTVAGPLFKTELRQYNEWLPISNNYSGNFGISRKLSSNATMGSSANYNQYQSADLTKGRTNEFENDTYLRYTILKTDESILNKSLTATLFYNFVTDSLDKKLDVQVNFAHYKNDGNRLTANSYYNTLDSQTYSDNQIIYDESPTVFNILSAKIDFENKLSKSVVLGTGAKYSYVDNDYKMVLKDGNDVENLMLNTGRSNELLYKESIVAAYGISNFSLSNFEIQAGLRAEFSNYVATSVTNNSKNSDHYVSLFPSFSLNGNFESNQFKLSYSRRIQRPNYLYLNPYFTYIDTYNIEIGNPDLTPEFTNAFEFTWINKQKTSLSLFTNFSKDEMYQIVAYDDTTKITTLYYNNIGKSTTIGLSLNTSLSLQKWGDLQFNSEISYGQAASELTGYQFDDSGVSYYIGINQSYTIAKDWSATWNSFYSARGNYGNTNFKPSYDTSLGMRKDFFNKKLRINLSAQNILKKSQWIQTTKQGDVTTNWVNRWETRKFTLSATYNFGAGKKKEVKEADLDAEQSRL